MWSLEDEAQPWTAMLRRLVADQAEDVTQENAFQLSLPWWALLAPPLLAALLLLWSLPRALSKN
jgi:hypothetical protein